jgi:hypothetical protein
MLTIHCSDKIVQVSNDIVNKMILLRTLTMEFPHDEVITIPIDEKQWTMITRFLETQVLDENLDRVTLLQLYNAVNYLGVPQMKDVIVQRLSIMIREDFVDENYETLLKSWSNC